MSSSFKAAIKGVRSILVERIDVSNGLLDELRDRNVLTARHVHNIQLPSLTEFERAEKLLDILERRPDSLLPAFKEALIETDQQYIWDDYLSSAVAVIPVHMNVTSKSALPANFDGDFSSKLLTVISLLRRHLERSQIISLRAKLGSTELDEFERDLLKSELDEKIEQALRQGYNVDPCVMRELKVSCRFMLVYGAEPVFAQPAHSIVIYLLCRSVEGVVNVGKMTSSGVLSRLLRGAVKEHLASPIDVDVAIRLNPDDYQSALTCFDSQPADAFRSTGSAQRLCEEASTDNDINCQKHDNPHDDTTLDAGEQLTPDRETEKGEKQTENETETCVQQTRETEIERQQQLRLNMDAAQSEIAALKRQLQQEQETVNELVRRNEELENFAQTMQLQLQNTLASVPNASDGRRQLEAGGQSETQRHDRHTNYFVYQQMPIMKMWQPRDIENLTDDLLTGTVNNEDRLDSYSLTDGLKKSLLDFKTYKSNVSKEKTLTETDLMKLNLCRLMLMTSSKKKQLPIIDFLQNKTDSNALYTNVIDKSRQMQQGTSKRNVFNVLPGSSGFSNLTTVPGIHSLIVDEAFRVGNWRSVKWNI